MPRVSAGVRCGLRAWAVGSQIDGARVSTWVKVEMGLIISGKLYFPTENCY